MTANIGRSSISCLIGAIAFLLPALRAHAEIETKYDRFKDLTAVYLRTTFSTSSSRTANFALISTYTGQAASRGGEVAPGALLTMFISSDEWRYLKCRGLSALIDGKPLELPPLDHDGKVGRGYVTENLKAMISLETVATIANAKKSLEFKLCNDEFTLPLSVAADARRFLDELGAAPAVPSPPADVPLDLVELERTNQIIKCNIEKSKEGSAPALIADVCGGIFRNGKLELKTR